MIAPTTRILPIPDGWLPRPGDTFYPDDLPEDWRLAYFAAHFPGVLVASEVWRGLDSATLRSHVADTPAEFRFFLDLARGATHRDQLALVAAGLGDRLGGIVGEPSVLRPLPECCCPLYRRTDPGACVGEVRGDGLAFAVPVELVGDLRASRAWLEGIGAAANGMPVLALTPGDAGFAAREQWLLLVRLLGFA